MYFIFSVYKKHTQLNLLHCLNKIMLKAKCIVCQTIDHLFKVCYNTMCCLNFFESPCFVTILAFCLGQSKWHATEVAAECVYFKLVLLLFVYRKRFQGSDSINCCLFSYFLRNTMIKVCTHSGSNLLVFFRPGSLWLWDWHKLNWAILVRFNDCNELHLVYDPNNIHVYQNY